MQKPSWVCSGSRGPLEERIQPPWLLHNFTPKRYRKIDFKLGYRTGSFVYNTDLLTGTVAN
jgi:hypothetical protein